MSDEMGLVERLRAKWTDSDSIQLHMGECSAQELRSIKAVAISILSEIKPEIERLVAERDEAREALKLMQPLGAVHLPQGGKPSVRLRDIFPADFAAVDAVLAGRARQALGDT